MRTATVRQVQHRLASVLAWVAEGETIDVTRNRRVVARIVPPPPATTVPLPDFLRRLKEIYPRGVAGLPLSKIIDEQRGPRP